MLPKRNEVNSRGSIQDRSWDLLAEMWLHREAEALAEALDADQAAGRTSEMDQFFATYDARNLQLIQKATQRQRTKRLLKRTLPRMVRIAALWIAVLAIGGGIAMAASPTVRVYLVKLLMETTPQYTRLQLVEDVENYVDVPAEWQGTYYPTLIPPGLVQASNWMIRLFILIRITPCGSLRSVNWMRGQRSRSTRRTRKSAR